MDINLAISGSNFKVILRAEKKIMNHRRRPRVVIVGAGFGGLWALRGLTGEPVEVIVVDRNNYHTFLPLLYQVAAAEVEPEEIAYPIRELLRGRKNARFIMAEVKEVNWEAGVVKTDGPDLAYDFLILALGSTPQFFGVPGAAKYAFPLRTMEQGIALRNHLLRCFERAGTEQDSESRKRLLTFSIVGGGPTGVEFAGALSELIRGPLAKDYPNLDFQEIQLVLLEARDTLLPGMPGKLQKYALSRLKEMGVEVNLHSPVSRVTDSALYLEEGEKITAETVVWTAGMRGHPLAQNWGLPTAEDGRVKVLPTMQVPNHRVFAIGDLAYFNQKGHPLPMLAPVAVQQGEIVGQNIIRLLQGKKPTPFRYRDRGTMATIGRKAAVAKVFGKAFTGFPAWILWLGFHLYKLIGFRNRLFVMINWGWDYFFHKRSVRLILPGKGDG